jgi:mRNA interferase MazF
VSPGVGEIWLTDLEPAVANEQGGVRPCLVISSDAYNRMPIRHVIIAPVTTKDRQLDHHVEIADEGGLDRVSFVMTEGARAISVQRCLRPLGQVSPDTLALARFHVRKFLGQGPPRR